MYASKTITNYTISVGSVAAGSEMTESGESGDTDFLLSIPPVYFDIRLPDGSDKVDSENNFNVGESLNVGLNDTLTDKIRKASESNDRSYLLNSMVTSKWHAFYGKSEDLYRGCGTENKLSGINCETKIGVVDVSQESLVPGVTTGCTCRLPFTLPSL